MSDNPFVSVKNVIGSGKHSEPKDSKTWEEHWEIHSHFSWPDKCQCCKKESAQVGGHVTIVGSDRTQYILPMCRSCNGIPGEVFPNVNKDYLVPVVPPKG